MVAVLPLSLLLLLASATGASARAFSAFRSNDTDASLGREIQKRYSDARFTYFDTGLGACGGTNVASDFIVALNSDQYGGGEDCYKMIEITYNGKSAQAQIVDECPGCPYAGLDFSTGLFTHFAPESVGVIYGEWNFVDGSTTTSTTKKTTTTTKPPATAASPTTTTTRASVVTTPETSSTESPSTSTPIAVPSPTVAGALTSSASMSGLSELQQAFNVLLVVAAGGL